MVCRLVMPWRWRLYYFETPSWCARALHRLLRCGRTREGHWDNENTHEMRVNSKRIRYAMNGERSGSEYYGLKGVFCRTVNRAPSLCGFRGPPRPTRTLSHRQLRFRKSRDNRRQRKTSVRLTNTSVSRNDYFRQGDGPDIVRLLTFETVFVYYSRSFGKENN